MIYTLTLNPAIDRELTITEVQFDSVLPAVHSRVDVGGKGFNVSRLLWSMGTPSIALGFQHRVGVRGRECRRPAQRRPAGPGCCHGLRRDLRRDPHERQHRDRTP